MLIGPVSIPPSLLRILVMTPYGLLLSLRIWFGKNHRNLICVTFHRTKPKPKGSMSEAAWRGEGRRRGSREKSCAWCGQTFWHNRGSGWARKRQARKEVLKRWVGVQFSSQSVCLCCRTTRCPVSKYRKIPWLFFAGAYRNFTVMGWTKFRDLLKLVEAVGRDQ